MEEKEKQQVTPENTGTKPPLFPEVAPNTPAPNPRGIWEDSPECVLSRCKECE